MTGTRSQAQDDKPLIYTEYSVPCEIADVVQCGWSFVARADLVGAYAHHVLPDGCISLVYRVGVPPLGGMLILSGPRVRELRVDVYARNQFWGIRFWPDTGAALLGLDPVVLREHSVPLIAHAPPLAEELTSALNRCSSLEAALQVFHGFAASRRGHCLPLDEAVREAIIAIHSADGAEPIATIAAEVGLSPRQFQRRFRARVGLTPKEYARIRRMRTALFNALQGESKDWASVAANSGYSDQAHLSRDAAALTGLTPAGFEARIRPIDHQNVEP